MTTFPLGSIVATPDALRAVEDAKVESLSLLRRHASGDWGDVPKEDARENDLSVDRGQRILSSYRLPTGKVVWVITEWDRSATTFLLPEEY